MPRTKENPDAQLVCLVYDPDYRIKNPHGLLNDLNSQHDPLSVRVLIVPSR